MDIIKFAGCRPENHKSHISELHLGTSSPSIGGKFNLNKNSTSSIVMFRKLAQGYKLFMPLFLFLFCEGAFKKSAH